jgi:hypothetical protein
MFSVNHITSEVPMESQDPVRVDLLVDGKMVSWAPVSSFWEIHNMVGTCYKNLRDLGLDVEVRVRDSRDATIPVDWYLSADGFLEVSKEV